MQPPAVGIEEGHDVDGHDIRVEYFSILEIVVPDLVNDIAKEFGDASFGRLVTGKVIEAGFMGRLCTNTDDCCGIVGDVSIVEGEVGGTYELLLPWLALYLTVSVRMAMREWIPFNWLSGMTMRRGRRVSRMASRSSSVALFPSRGAKVLYASLNRRVMVSGVMLR